MPFKHLYLALTLVAADISTAAALPQRLLAGQHNGGYHRAGWFSQQHDYPDGDGHDTHERGLPSDESQYSPLGNDPRSVSPSGLIAVPSSTPTDACPKVDLDFIGFAFEQADLVPYVQNRDGTVNQFSLNLIDAIMSRTGGKPIVRLGGTSGDYATYQPGQEEPALPRSEANTYQKFPGTSIGPSYWKLTHNIPNAVYIVQLPMAQTNVSEAVAWAQSAADGIGLDRIQAFEPGNEPDLYPIGDLRPPEYQGKLTNETYTGNFTKYVAAIKEAVSTPDGPFFQAFDTAAHLGSDAPVTSYILDVETNFNLGIDAGNSIKTVASHYYQTAGGSAADLGIGLMNHAAIASRLDLIRKFITYLAANHPTIPYIISEVGNSLNPTHDYDSQATLGSALWSVDFQLYAMSIGVARINWQQIMHAGYDMWLPLDSAGLERKVYSNFYAMPFVADFIGLGGETRAAQLETGIGNVVAYVAYVGSTPVRIAVVNLNTWDQGSGVTRRMEKLAFVVPKGCRRVKVTVLSSPEGAHASGDSMSYAGSQWTSDSEGLEVQDFRSDTKMLDVKRGEVVVEVAHSSAVLVHLL